MSIPQWTVELHAHTNYSRDGVVRLDELQGLCRAKGIDKLAITDHNRVDGALTAARLYPMLVIPGLEVKTTKGEILAWYISEDVPVGLSPQETISRLRDQEALIGVPHPFDRYRSGAWELDDLLEIVELVDIIEVFNSRCLHQADNDKALAFAEEHGKLMTCGSDAHMRSEFGHSVMHVEPFASTAEGLKSAIESATRQEKLSSKTVHLWTKFVKIAKPYLKSLNPTT
jgi:predicted metal-dependent phosphoesterase TrpH